MTEGALFFLSPFLPLLLPLLSKLVRWRRRSESSCCTSPPLPHSASSSVRNEEPRLQISIILLSWRFLGFCRLTTGAWWQPQEVLELSYPQLQQHEFEPPAKSVQYWQSACLNPLMVALIMTIKFENWPAIERQRVPPPCEKYWRVVTGRASGSTRALTPRAKRP